VSVGVEATVYADYPPYPRTGRDAIDMLQSQPRGMLEAYKPTTVRPPPWTPGFRRVAQNLTLHTFQSLQNEPDEQERDAVKLSR